jgi:ankyrin repeat protein
MLGSVNEQNDYGRAIPHVFINAEGDLAAFSLLLSHKRIDINLIDNDGRTPLIFAAQQGQDKVEALIRHRRMDIHVKDDDGKNVLEHTPEEHKAKVVESINEAISVRSVSI